MRKRAQNNSSNGLPDAALEGTLHDRLNVALEEPLKIHKKMTKRMHLTL